MSMRYLKLASAKNPSTDFIELNDFNGFLCTSFQTVGISRKLDFLAIKDRQFVVDNKTNFKKYNLTIEILTKYAEYEAKHRELILFLDRNKKDGFRLYYRPYGDMDLRYCLCDIESSNRPEKMQPVLLTLSQGSLWLSEEKKATISFQEQEGNLFAFEYDDENENYSAKFLLDDEISNYYCIAFYGGAETIAEIENKSYTEIPLNIRIKGRCVNPTVSLFRKGEVEPIRILQIMETIEAGDYVEINSNILDNGVWYVDTSTNRRIAYDDKINNALGSPYFYIGNGEYYATIEDDGANRTSAEIFWQEEYNE